MAGREQRYVRFVSACRRGLNAMNAETEGLQAEFKLIQQDIAKLRTAARPK
jgi:hypothetical protein